MLLHMLFSNSQETPAFSITIPCKVQSHIAAGKPILTMLSSEGPRIIEEAKCGYDTSSGNFRILALKYTHYVGIGWREINYPC